VCIEYELLMAMQALTLQIKCFVGSELEDECQWWLCQPDRVPAQPAGFLLIAGMYMMC
jgi:hypothetical protein